MTLRVEQLEGRTVPTLVGAAGGVPLGESWTPDLSQTFLLHSLPEAVRQQEIAAGTLKTLWLNFQGETTTNSVWNNYTGGAPIVTPAFSQDADPTTFTAAELATVQRIWQRVAEDYAPFNLDVTTQPPPASYINADDSFPDNEYGQEVIVGGNGSWYGSAGGVSQRGSFGGGLTSHPLPDFVFSVQLGNDEKYVAEAASHEAGHTFGLSHDGTTTGTTYYAGGGGWAPIMGYSYAQPVTQWSAGEYPSANNTQDQVGIIAQHVGYRPDDFAHATALVSGRQVTGLIGTRQDVDVFSFTTAAGAVTLNFLPAASGADLYAQESLYDAAGNLVAIATPASPSSLGFTLSVTLAAGTYFVTVDGVGIPGAATTTDYGSLGQYWLAVQAAADTPVSPPTTSAVFVGPDATTQGSWRGIYGADGYWLSQGTESLPGYATASVAGNLNYTWARSTSDPRALEQPGTTSRLAACWYSATAFSVNVSFTDGLAHAVSLYLLDWDRLGRSERIDVLDGAGNVLDTRTASGFTGGEWLTWEVSGAVTFRVAKTGGCNAVLSGLFVG